MKKNFLLITLAVSAIGISGCVGPYHYRDDYYGGYYPRDYYGGGYPYDGPRDDRFGGYYERGLNDPYSTGRDNYDYGRRDYDGPPQRYYGDQ